MTRLISTQGCMNRLSLFCDVSGWISKESQRDRSFSVGGVVIPTSDEARIRATLAQNTPKWADSNASSLSVIENVLMNNDGIHCTVVRIHKTEPMWTKFWDDGENRWKGLPQKIRSKSKHTGPGNILQGWAIGKCYAIALGSCIYLQGKPAVLGPDGLSILYLRITCDTDIKGKHNQDAFEYSWKVWHDRTRVPARFGIRPEVESIEFKTEQDEVSLLLPDYLAGYWQYSSDETGHVRRPTRLTHQDANHFGQVLSGLKAAGRLTVVGCSFNEIFPNLGSP